MAGSNSPGLSEHVSDEPNTVLGAGHLTTFRDIQNRAAHYNNALRVNLPNQIYSSVVLPLKAHPQFPHVATIRRPRRILNREDADVRKIDMLCHLRYETRKCLDILLAGTVEPLEELVATPDQ